jgi:hypothetical protein
LVVLTFYLPIPILLPSCFSTSPPLYPSISAHLRPLVGWELAACVCVELWLMYMRWVVVESQCIRVTRFGNIAYVRTCAAAKSYTSSHWNYICTQMHNDR